jgi:hypothetical protein
MSIEREEFEAWYRKEYANLPVGDRLKYNDLNDEYFYPFVDGMFHAWQKSTKREAELLAEIERLKAQQGAGEPVELLKEILIEVDDYQKRTGIAVNGWPDKVRNYLYASPQPSQSEKTGLSLSDDDVHFLACRIKVLANLIDYKLPNFTEKQLIGVAGTVLGAIRSIIEFDYVRKPSREKGNE